MTNGEAIFKNWTRVIFLIAIVITAVFIAIFGVLGVRINREVGCGWDYTGAHPNAAISNHSTMLDNADDFVLQEFELNTTEYLKHKFCFSVIVEPAAGLELDVVNANETILSQEFAIQGLRTYCSEIEVTDHQYIGLECPKCDNSHKAVIQQATIGDTVIHVEQDNEALTIDEEASLAYTLFSLKSCKGTLKFFIWCYLWLMIALGVLLLIIVGFNRFEKMLFEGWKL